MKKKIVARIIIAFFLLVFTTIILYKRNQPPDFIKKMVMDNKTFYDGVADFYYNDFKEHKDGNEVLAYSFIDGDTVYCYSDPETRRIHLDDDEVRMFSMVDSSYYVDDKNVERVYVYDDYVSFCNIDGRISIVYSAGNMKPKCVGTPNDQKKNISAVRITENWYYVEWTDKLFHLY